MAGHAGSNVSTHKFSRKAYIMTTFQEIEFAARRLTADERRKLLISLAESLRAEGRSLPPPRSFTAAEIGAWIEEDERDLTEYRRGS